MQAKATVGSSSKEEDGSSPKDSHAATQYSLKFQSQFYAFLDINKMPPLLQSKHILRHNIRIPNLLHDTHELL